jgi:RNA polymerase sigma-70 factor (ECF subfamily)
VKELEVQMRGLMLAALAGDGAALRQFLALLAVRLRAYFARRIGGQAPDVEDLVQETLLAVYSRRATYDPAQPVTAWAHAIARYKLIDHYRRRKLRLHTPIEDVEDFLAADAPDPDAGFDVDRALAGLTPRQAGLVRDVKIKGLSLAEAGERAGMTPGAAKVGLHRALKALRARVGLE